jgi:hypothetical protein
MKPKKLPIGQSSFENLISNNFIYVDKTRKLYKLITEGEFYFLSRPRRFGKSLLVSALKNIFLGNKELFKDLWIYTSDYEWEKHPVVVIDFNAISLETPEIFLRSLSRYLDEKGECFNVKLTGETVKEKFKELIIKISDSTGEKVVVLIDEYDKPIISHLGKGERALETAKENREILKSFYGTIKAESVIRNLRFVLLTGVSKFSKAGVFSELNNLNDITMNSKYSDLLGITIEELKIYFDYYLEETGEEFSIDKEELILRITDYYNGYRFSEKDLKIINPYSLLCFFNNQSFKNYWFESGTPTFLVNLIKERDFYLPRAEELVVEESIFSSYELDNLSPEALLFQTGYLTVKDYDFMKNRYVLSYPNREVKYAFLKILYRSYVREDRDNLYMKLGDCLEEGDVEGFIEIGRRIFSGVAYSVGSKLNEANFHTIFYLMVNAGGTPADMEILTSDGRIDMVVMTRDKIYIMEFKCNQSAEKAINQIKDKYVSRFTSNVSRKQLYLVGINFDTDSRNITEYKYEIIKS